MLTGQNGILNRASQAKKAQGTSQVEELAKLKLQEKPQDRFITFINQDTNKVNVLFKMKDNKNFGLVEPEA